MKNTGIIVCLLVVGAVAQQRGNGDKIDSFPNFIERQLYVLTNACRMAPAQYRDLYIGNYQVLLPANYPAIRPLYWNLALNKSSHAHSLDMAFVCGMQHPSCDGTAWDVRIKSFYTKSSALAENIATGNQTALATVKQWVLEVDPTTTPVPADNSGSDGHRKNIMTSSYRELGCGYAKGTQKCTYFWTQDFAGGKPDFNNPLVTGCHFFIETGKISFFVNYFDSVAVAPSEVSCLIEGQMNAMTLALGAAGKGTYTLVQTKGTACRKYYFSCVKNGTTYRYPEYGVLSTYGEGTCMQDYYPPESLSVFLAPNSPVPPDGFRLSFLQNGHLGISGLLPFDYPAQVRITNILGRTIVSRWFSFESTGNTRLSVDLPKRNNSETGIVSINTRSGKKQSWLIVTGK